MHENQAFHLKITTTFHKAILMTKISHNTTTTSTTSTTTTLTIATQPRQQHQQEGCRPNSHMKATRVHPKQHQKFTMNNTITMTTNNNNNNNKNNTYNNNNNIITSPFHTAPLTLHTTHHLSWHQRFTLNHINTTTTNLANNNNNIIDLNHKNKINTNPSYQENSANT